MSGKYALIIGNTEYTDAGLEQLIAPSKDAAELAQILQSRDIAAFDDVKVLLNKSESIVRESVFEFFAQKKRDDLLLMYFSGHGIRDEYGALHLAVTNTRRDRLHVTAIGSDFITKLMDQSQSKRQVLILDCCNSGAFSEGAKGAIGGNMGIFDTFLGKQGYGRVILTATNSIQFAWEGTKIDEILGEKTGHSLFTHFLVKGLKGEADHDGDGRITVDELYKYASDEIARLAPLQKPQKRANFEEGDIVLRQIMRIEDIKLVSLPDDLVIEIEDIRPGVREWAVQRLEQILKGKNIGMARAAREALERMEREDDSRRVSQAATQVLEPFRQAEEERKAKEEAERIAAQKAEEERIALEKAEAERQAKQEADRLLAEQKAEKERNAREEAERIAKAEQERLAREKAESERKAKEEAERLLAEQKADEELKAKKEAKRLATLKAKEERLALKKVEAERKAKEEAGRIAIQKAEQERLARQKAEAEQKAKEEAEKLAHAKAKRDATEKAAREKAAKEKAEREAAEREAMERAAGENENSTDRFVYVIAEDGTPLYHYFPSSNNWNVWLERGAKLTLIQPAVDEISIGKFGRNIKVSDEQGNQGYVRAAAVSIERESAKKAIKKEPATNKIRDRIDVKANTAIEPFIVPHEDSIWKFGRQEIFRGLVGAILFAIVGMFTDSLGLIIGLRSSVLVFFSIAFGPWVGLLTGALGHIGYLIYLSYFP